jgi:hypothetical protein
MTKTVSQKVHHRITKKGEGWVFSAHDFLDLGSRAAVDHALARLAKQTPAKSQTIYRLERGLYYYPETSLLTKNLLLPTPDQVVGAFARKSQTRIQITGAKAANALGLSLQVPARVAYLTDGANRTIPLGNMTIELRHVSPRQMAGAGKIEGAVLQALRHIGKGNITLEDITHLKSLLSKQDKEALYKESVHAPAWLLPTLLQIVSEEEQ